MEEIKEVSSPQQAIGSPVLEVADSGTQMSAEKPKATSRRRGRHALYNTELQISEPFDSGSFVVRKTILQNVLYSTELQILEPFDSGSFVVRKTILQNYASGKDVMHYVQSTIQTLTSVSTKLI